MQDALQPRADQLAEEGIKPAGKQAKEAVQKAQDQIPEPGVSKRVAEEQVGKAAKPAAQAVKDNAQPLADKVNPLLELQVFANYSSHPNCWTGLP